MKSQSASNLQKQTGIICLLVLLAFVFFPSLHKLEHALKDSGHNHAGCSHPDQERCDHHSQAGNRQNLPHSSASQAAARHPTHFPRTTFGKECQVCRDMHLLSLNSLTLPAAEPAAVSSPEEKPQPLFGSPVSTGVLPAKQARAPPFPAHPPSA